MYDPVKRKAAYTRYHHSEKWKATHRTWVKTKGHAYFADIQLRFYRGISLVQKLAMLAAQGMQCKVCGSFSPKFRKGWATDHDPLTGRIRGILCHPCNLALGNVDDSMERLFKLIGYLGSSTINDETVPAMLSLPG